VTLTRRHLLAAAAALAVPRLAFGAGGAVEIAMQGRGDGSHVWFDPVGVRVMPGQTVRWTNREAGNVHTTTAYHPENFGRQQRIPAAAKPWNSDYLLPGESFAVVLTEPGVYDCYCIPHEHAGMVGRIVVGETIPADWHGWPDGDLPEVALEAFPLAEAILRQGNVRRS
jgi:plastocyanin